MWLADIPQCKTLLCMKENSRQQDFHRMLPDCNVFSSSIMGKLGGFPGCMEKIDEDNLRRQKSHSKDILGTGRNSLVIH